MILDMLKISFWFFTFLAYICFKKMSYEIIFISIVLVVTSLSFLIFLLGIFSLFLLTCMDKDLLIYF